MEVKLSNKDAQKNKLASTVAVNGTEKLAGNSESSCLDISLIKKLSGKPW